MIVNADGHGTIFERTEHIAEIEVFISVLIVVFHKLALARDIVVVAILGFFFVGVLIVLQSARGLAVFPIPMRQAASAAV